MTRARLKQIIVIARLELRRAFFSKRAFWVYLLALFPAVIFFGHGIEVKTSQRRSAGHSISPSLADSYTRGETVEDIIKRSGDPMRDFTWRTRRRNEPDTERRSVTYTDGRRRIHLEFENGILRSKYIEHIANFEEDRQIFASVFQFFYLRLAIFFGCLGIFMNLFRGEMLDKTLHFWMLLPVRREVLLGGKYLAGLTAATVIFTAGAVLCFGTVLWPQDPAEVQSYWQGPGPMHLFWYAVASALACLGYGSVFLAAGLILRNPIIPAGVLLVWESANPFLPELLQKFSVLYYLQSLCPVAPPVEKNLPTVLRMLVAPPNLVSPAVAILGLLALTALVLWAASRSIRRLEINYSTD